MEPLQSYHRKQRNSGPQDMGAWWWSLDRKGEFQRNTTSGNFWCERFPLVDLLSPRGFGFWKVGIWRKDRNQHYFLGVPCTSGDLCNFKCFSRFWGLPRFNPLFPNSSDLESVSGSLGSFLGKMKQKEVTSPKNGSQTYRISWKVTLIILMGYHLPRLGWWIM